MPKLPPVVPGARPTRSNVSQFVTQRCTDTDDDTSADESLHSGSPGSPFSGDSKGSFCTIRKQLSIPSPSSLDIGLTTATAVATLKVKRRESVRRQVRMAFSRGEQRVKRPDQETLAQIESTDLNKGIKHILVSNDTSSMGGRSFETILPFLAKDSARRVTAIRCYDKLGRANAADVDLEIRNKLESLALKYDLITNVHVNMAEIAEGDDVGAVLVKEAEALGPDLVVVGTKHTGVFCGHTCDTVVHESSVPVLVVRSFGCPHNPKARIMVAVDGSVVSLAALRYTVRLASALMTVVPVVIVPGGPKIAALVKQAIETVEGPRCVVEEPVVANMREQFNVGQSLCAVADELNADIIALGADNKGDQELGNVESFLIYQANCHVLVYKNEWLMDRQGTSSGSNSRRASKMSRRESLKIPHDGPRGSFVRTLSQLPADVDGISEERQSMESNAPPDATDFTFGSAEYLPVTLADK